MAPQARYWLLTISCEENDLNPERLRFDPSSYESKLPESIQWVRGQREIGTNGYEHWQIYVSFKRKIRRGSVLAFFGGNACHAEPTIGTKAIEYVWKEATRVDGSQFEYGTPAINRGSED